MNKKSPIYSGILIASILLLGYSSYVSGILGHIIIDGPPGGNGYAGITCKK